MNPSKMYCHRVEIYTGKKKSYESDVFRVEEADVLAENNNQIVLNDAAFTKLDKKVDKTFNCYPVVGIPSTDVNVDNGFWSDGIVFRLYSFDEWSPNRIEGAIKAAIAKTQS